MRGPLLALRAAGGECATDGGRGMGTRGTIDQTVTTTLMRPARSLTRFAWLALAAWAGSGLALAVEGLPEPIATRQKSFAIPFRFPVTATAPQADVDLYVSNDRGQTWQLYGTERLPKNSFTFRAVEDGEFWFSVRTRSHGGAARPEGQAKVELRVIVDTASPKLALTAQRGAGGELRAQLEISDLQLKP